jgi:hypothetical protein
MALALAHRGRQGARGFPAWRDQLKIGRDGVATGQFGGQSFSGTWDARSHALEGEIDCGYKFRGYYNPSTGRVYGDIPDPTTATRPIDRIERSAGSRGNRALQAMRYGTDHL